MRAYRIITIRDTRNISLLILNRINPQPSTISVSSMNVIVAVEIACRMSDASDSLERYSPVLREDTESTVASIIWL